MEENLGNKLRRARESAGLTVDDAVYLAKMPRAVVEALEADDFGFFTSPLYARSFLKQYGDYVNLDVSPWIVDLVPTAMIDGDAVDSIIEIEEPVQPVHRERQKKSGGGGSLAALWLIVITGGLVWGGRELFKDFESKHAKAPAPVQEVPTKPDEPAPRIVAVEEEIKTVTTDGPEPAKRAIIVREEE
jgi:cytoskeletal protein RodZ